MRRGSVCSWRLGHGRTPPPCLTRRGSLPLNRNRIHLWSSSLLASYRHNAVVCAECLNVVRGTTQLETTEEEEVVTQEHRQMPYTGTVYEVT